MKIRMLLALAGLTVGPITPAFSQTTAKDLVGAWTPRINPPSPERVGAYSLRYAVGDVVGILDALGIDAADVVGHDWGAAVAWFTATPHPDHVHKLVVLSVRHPLAPRTLRQREMAWLAAVLPIRGNRGGVAAARRLGTPAGVEPRQR
jgi:pimeloyl-ACP methyl ester carboxylesterase